ncbi:hypothetical protein F3Y22_tig00116964pilonHSYRG00178 [Hibiscus syriacus]|uniref:Protein kinase domain-containing protein n=1 Tax=Hibiscus syriacus TaxID=106335 RepID=A0A6A2WK96_HIBSY|nr:hypothetical protein F3Y22_tig00116964pilonHSYRG00178 [Hibiscus syriacus]
MKFMLWFACALGVEFISMLFLNRARGDENIVERLNEANQGEAEFLAEYMEQGSMVEKLESHQLDWQKRYDIALGSAKGLACLHDECLEWILHRDVKPQNILFDSGYRPKVSDFGLSELLDRGKLSNYSFSKIRGTRDGDRKEPEKRDPVGGRGDGFGNMGEGEEERIRVKGNVDEQIVDPTLEDKYDKKMMGILVQVALQCVPGRQRCKAHHD